MFDVKVFRAKRRHVDAEKKHYVCVLLNAIFVNSFLRGEEVGCFELQMVQVGWQMQASTMFVRPKQL